MEYSLVPKVKSIIQDKRKLFYLFSIITLAVPIIIPVFFDPYWIKLYSEILIWSLLAASVNILFGYLGLLSFGQALFFGFGMYGVAIAITKFGVGLWGSFAFGIFASTLMALISGSLAV